MEDVLFLAPRKYSQTTDLILDRLRKHKVKYYLSSIEDTVIVVSGSEEKIYHKEKDISSPMFVFPRIDGKRKSEGFKILSYYELKGIKTTYPANVLNIVHDKFLTSLYLSKYSLPVPKTIYLGSPYAVKDIEFPVILKVLSGSGGKGVMLIENQEAFESILLTLKEATDKREEILIQEYIKKEVAEDIRILVVGDRIVGAMKRIAKKGEVRSNVKVGGGVVGYVPTKEEEDLALKACKYLGIEVCGVDIIVDDNGNPYIMELNLSPGIRGLMKATDRDVADEIALYIKDKLKR